MTDRADDPSPTPTVRLQAPTASQSGYGARSRELLRTLRAAALDVVHRPYEWPGERVLEPPAPDEDREVNAHVFVGTPEDTCRDSAAANVLVTAGTEVDRLSPEAVAGMNRADAVLVPSRFSKRVAESTGYHYEGKTLRVEPDVLVQHETPSYDPDAEPTQVSEEVGDALEASGAFLCVATWLDRRAEVGRKGVTDTLRVFAALSGAMDDPPALVLKTDAGGLSEPEREGVVSAARALKGDAEVVLLQGVLTRAEMHSLYTAPWARGLISLSKGEAFGRPVAEAGLHGLPVVCPGHTGHLDHTDEELQVLIGADAVEAPVHEIGYTRSFPRGSWWMQPDTAFAAQAVAAVHANPCGYRARAEEHARALRSQLSETRARRALTDAITHAIRTQEQDEQDQAGSFEQG